MRVKLLGRFFRELPCQRGIILKTDDFSSGSSYMSKSDKEIEKFYKIHKHLFYELVTC